VTPEEYARRAAVVIRQAQRGLADRPDAGEGERWGAALRLDGASADERELVIRFTEPDGRRINYRKVLGDDDGYDALAHPEESLRNLSWHFEEDVLTCERSGPDAEGVRWFGDDD